MKLIRRFGLFHLDIESLASYHFCSKRAYVLSIDFGYRRSQSAKNTLGQDKSRYPSSPTRSYTIAVLYFPLISIVRIGQLSRSSSERTGATSSSVKNWATPYALLIDMARSKRWTRAAVASYGIGVLNVQALPLHFTTMVLFINLYNFAK